MPVSPPGVRLPHFSRLASGPPALPRGISFPILSKDPGCPATEEPMTREERYAAAEKLKDDGDLAGAIAALEALVAEDPGFALAHSALGAWCTRVERHADAVRHARRACELEPRDPFSYTALSVACMRAGMIPEAEEALARSRMLQGG